MATIVDDTGESIETGEVLYDLEVGAFVRFELDDEILREIDVFSGEVIHKISVDEFEREGLSSEYRTIPDKVLEQPESVLEEVLDAVLTGARDSCAGYEPWEVRFAQHKCSFESQPLQ